MDGKAVQWGAYGRGGWKYQTLAMILTYLSIVGSYVPMIVREIGKPKTETSAPARGASTRTPEARPAVATQGAAFFAFGLLALLALACALPFLAGIRNIMGLVIIGIGLYEAWKFNRRRVIEITGPHTLAAA